MTTKTNQPPHRINVTLSTYEGDAFPNADELFESYVLAELTRQHPNAAIDVSTAQGRTRVAVDGEPDQDLAQEIGADWWAAFCSESEPDNTEGDYDPDEDRTP